MEKVLYCIFTFCFVYILFMGALELGGIETEGLVRVLVLVSGLYGV